MLHNRADQSSDPSTRVTSLAFSNACNSRFEMQAQEETLPTSKEQAETNGRHPTTLFLAYAHVCTHTHTHTQTNFKTKQPTNHGSLILGPARWKSGQLKLGTLLLHCVQTGSGMRKVICPGLRLFGGFPSSYTESHFMLWARRALTHAKDCPICMI